MVVFTCPAPGLFHLPLVNELEKECEAFRLNWNREEVKIPRRGAQFFIAVMKDKQPQKPVAEADFTPPHRPVSDEPAVRKVHVIISRSSFKHAYHR